ncbi:hypothetical protein KDH_02440 [Dictyobacter sp. S3.2.2.5]|uniref:DNA-directed RNA polymerase sigma-70 factor n=1 Tax=Dictyobacter halimunensis TaxID=3026934 RepID=A0ABQ6FIG2_9CHLR|nr:hypothetical protein KDH_02440 [Dictyobacter sp. S3.2.2.5]
MQHHPPTQESDAYPTDESALFDRYGSFIFSYILKHISSREDAEDLTLEVFTAALEQNTLRQLPPEKQLAWLTRVAHNKLIDAYRKMQHRQNVNIDIFSDILYGDDEPEQILMQKEIDHQLHQLIQQLSPFQQQLLYLRYAHNLSSAEIGALLNKGEDTIRQQLSRIRKHLRDSYLRHEQKGGR